MNLTTSTINSLWFETELTLNVYDFLGILDQIHAIRLGYADKIMPLIDEEDTKMWTTFTCR